MGQVIKILAMPFLKLCVSGVVAFSLFFLSLKVFHLTGFKASIPTFVPGLLTFVIFGFFSWFTKKILIPVLYVCGVGFVVAFGLYLVANKTGVSFSSNYWFQNGLLCFSILASTCFFLFLKHKRNFIVKSLEEIDKLGNGDSKKGGFLFEEYIASMYRKLGYDAATTGELKKKNLFKTKGFDQGADVVVNLVESGVKKRAIVQCKLYSSPVGNKAVQEILAALPIYSADYAIVITNNYFTAAAVELANANNVLLVDRKQLGVLIEQAANPKLAAMLEKSVAT